MFVTNRCFVYNYLELLVPIPRLPTCLSITLRNFRFRKIRFSNKCNSLGFVFLTLDLFVQLGEFCPERQHAFKIVALCQMNMHLYRWFCGTGRNRYRWFGILRWGSWSGMYTGFDRRCGHFDNWKMNQDNKCQKTCWNQMSIWHVLKFHKKPLFAD